MKPRKQATSSGRKLSGLHQSGSLGLYKVAYRCSWMKAPVMSSVKRSGRMLLKDSSSSLLRSTSIMSTTRGFPYRTAPMRTIRSRSGVMSWLTKRFTYTTSRYLRKVTAWLLGSTTSGHFPARASCRVVSFHSPSTRSSSAKFIPGRVGPEEWAPAPPPWSAPDLASRSSVRSRTNASLASSAFSLAFCNSASASLTYLRAVSASSLRPSLTHLSSSKILCSRLCRAFPSDLCAAPSAFSAVKSLLCSCPQSESRACAAAAACFCLCAAYCTRRVSVRETSHFTKASLASPEATSAGSWDWACTRGSAPLANSTRMTSACPAKAALHSGVRS
eukprot:RCo018753